MTVQINYKNSVLKTNVGNLILFVDEKFQINGLTKYISTYWNSKKLRCNAISPGPVEDGQPKIFIRKLKKHIPLNSLALKNEYRGAIQFLCSDASEYMTGQNLIIDGGRSVW